MKRASKAEAKGMVVREVVTPDSVSRGGAEGAEEKTDALPYGPGEIAAAWGLAVKGLAHQVAFGAMLCELDSCLTRETAQQRNQYSGETLKGWLAENCPAVNYKTAMRWKGMAEGVAGWLGVAAGEIPAMAGLLPPPGEGKGDGENARRSTPDARRSTGEGEKDDWEEKRERLAKMLEGRSQRDVWAALRGPGRPKGTPGGGRRALTAEEKTEHAWTEIRELLGKVAAYTQGPWIEMLPVERREWAARTMKDLAACFRDGKGFEA